MKWSVLACFLVAPGLAHASNWYFLLEGLDKSLYYIDISSVSVSGSVRRAWFSTVNPDGSYDKTFKAFKCAAREDGVVSVAQYKADSTFNGSSTPPAVRYTPIIPDTIGEAMLEAACALNTKQFIERTYGGLQVGLPHKHAEVYRTPPLADAPGVRTIADEDCIGSCADGYNHALENKISSYADCSTGRDSEFKRGCTLKVWYQK